MIRAVLDSNVIVSGVIRQEGAPGQLLRAALEAGKFTLVTSPFLLREVAETLWEEKSQMTPGQVQVRVIADDPDDNAVLSWAKEGDAAYIVIGDGHLLSLGAYEGIRIVTPAQFLRALAEEQR